MFSAGCLISSLLVFGSSSCTDGVSAGDRVALSSAEHLAPSPAIALRVGPEEAFSSASLAGSVTVDVRKRFWIENETERALDLVVTANADWLRAAPARAATLLPGARFELEVGLERAAAERLTEGLHRSTVRITDRVSGEILAAVGAELRVDAAASGYAMHLEPRTGIRVSGNLGALRPPEPRSYSWTNHGTSAIDYVRTVSEPWLVVSGEAAGVVAPGAAAHFDVGLEPGSLDALGIGSHHAQVIFAPRSDPARIAGVVDVTVRIDPDEQHSMQLDSPAELTISGPEGGPFTFSRRVLGWTNHGDTALDYTRNVSASWLAVSGPDVGSVSPQGRLESAVAVRAEAADLPPGEHLAEITFRDAAGGVVDRVPVLLEIGQSGLRASIARITAFHSPYRTAPHHAHFSAAGCDLGGTELRDAAIRWTATRDSDSSVVDRSFGVPEFGVVFEDPGTYTVTLQIRCPEDTAWRSVSSKVTVERRSERAVECWLDRSASVDGRGTSPSSPFNNLASAFRYIESSWVSGGEHVIHDRRGVDSVANARWDSDRSELRGRLIVDAYGTGDKPTIRHSSGILFRTGSHTAIALIDHVFYGDGRIGGSQLLRNNIEHEDDGDGRNFLLLRCDIRASGGTTYFSTRGRSPTLEELEAGEAGFLAIKGCTFQDGGNPNLLIEGSTQVLIQGTVLRAFGADNFNARIKYGRHIDIRGSMFEPRRDGDGVALRLHAPQAIDSEWVAISDCKMTADIWFSPDDQGGANGSAIRNVWIERLALDSAGRGLWAWVRENYVIRNCWVRCAATPIAHRGNPLTERMTGVVIENNSLVTLGDRSQTGIRFPSEVTHATFRNNVFSCPHATAGSYMFRATRSESPASYFDACDGNLLFAGSGARVHWADGFEGSASTLSQWRSATRFDRGSRAGKDSAADPRFVSPTGRDLDLHIQSQSAAVGLGVRAPAVFVDFDQDLRGRQMHAGADER